MEDITMGGIVDEALSGADIRNVSEHLCLWCRNFDPNEQKFYIKRNVNLNPSPESLKGTEADVFSVTDRQQTTSSKGASNSFLHLEEHRLSCKFCDLLWRTIQKYNPGKIYPETILRLSWEVDGRRITNGNQITRCTRRIRISWEDMEQKKHNAFMVLVAPSRHGDSNSSLKLDTSFLGRLFSTSSEIKAIIREWLHHCREKHDDGCRNKFKSMSAFRQLVRETYFGVIDVVEMRLILLPWVNGSPEGFIALSYVWGKDKIHEQSYITTRSNVMLRIQPGGLKSSWDSFPKTIQDTFELVKLLGHRYLWIDSLCIVQDSIHNWNANAKAMHLVYMNAYFTVCAADGDVTSGLRALGIAEKTTKGSEHRGSKATTERSERFDMGQKDSFLVSECRPGLHILVSRLPEQVIQDSNWNERAWTFQERMLSRRCLIFAGDRVYFQCRQMVMSQDIFPDQGGNGWSLDWTSSPLRTLAQLRYKAFWFYMECVRLYTGRQLARSKDILAAFEGVSWLLEQHFNAPLFQGLPTSHFDLALLWMPLGGLKRRRTTSTAQSRSTGKSQADEGDRDDVLNDDFGGKDFPSWSWCGWKNGKAEYTTDMLHGCLPDTRDWLKHHTWIQWHVRDFGGYLRPLWNMKKRSQDQSLEARWRGYAGNSPLSPPPEDHRTSLSVASGENHQKKRKRIDEIGINGQVEQGRGSQNDERETHRDNVPQQPLAIPLPGGREPKSEDRYQRATNTAYITNLPHNYYSEYSKASIQNYVPSTSATRIGLSNAKRSAPYINVVRTDQPAVNFSGTAPDSTKSEIEQSDDYGRSKRDDLGKSRTFTSILPDNPFGVIRDTLLCLPQFPDDVEEHAQAMPVLQFFTHTNHFHVKIRDTKSASETLDNLCHCEIEDMAGDWCGSIKLTSSWVANRQALPHLCIAISDAKSFTKEECPEWNYYIHKEREESEWDLYYVLLLERNVERALWERVGLGKIFQAAFANADWTEIKLG